MIQLDTIIKNLEDQIAALKAVQVGNVLPPVPPAQPGKMTVTDSFFEFIKPLEGLELTAYPDSGGVWTIGYGHTANVMPGQVITLDQAKSLLVSDVQWAIDAVNKLVKVPMSQNQFHALVDLVFNIGTGQFTASTLLRELNQDNYADVPTQLRRWIYDNRGQPVLKGRREADVAMWLS